MKRRLLWLMAIIVVVISISLLGVVPTYSAGWDGTVAAAFAGGDGTSVSPYLISTPGQLKLFSQNITNSIGTSSYYTITADIDYCSYTYVSAGNGSVAFTGVFEGGGHTISNLVISASTSNAGLISILGNGGSYATISNLTINNSTISGTGNVGAFVGMANGYTKMLNLANYATVSGTSNFVGGLLGTSSLTSNNIIKDCINYGTVTTSASYGGGIAGVVKGDGSYIKYSANFGSITANTIAGGIAGQVAGSSTAVNDTAVSNCYNAGLITATASDGLAGGILGKGIITTYVSGGTTYNSGTRIRCCYNIGKITDPNSSTNLDAIMHGDAYSYSSLYYDNYLHGTAPTSNNIQTTPLTTAHMTGSAALTYMTLDSGAWTTTSGYPILSEPTVATQDFSGALDIKFSLNNTSVIILDNKTFTLSMTLEPSGYTKSFSSSNSSVASVNSTGVITANAVGTAVITVTVTSTVTGDTQTATCPVQVVEYANGFASQTDDLKVHYLEVPVDGKSDAFIIEYRGEIYLIDGGNDNTTTLDYLKMIRREMLGTYLSQYNTDQDCDLKINLIISHFHSDHVTALYESVIKSVYMEVDDVYLMSNSAFGVSSGGTYNDARNADLVERPAVLSALNTYQTQRTLHYLGYGNTMTLTSADQAVTIKLYAPTLDWGSTQGVNYILDTYYSTSDPQEIYDEVPTAVVNANSMWCRVAYGDNAFLFTGDAMKKFSSITDEPLDRTLSVYGSELVSDVLQFPHHGQLRSAARLPLKTVVKPGTLILSFVSSDPNYVYYTLTNADTVILNADLVYISDGTSITCNGNAVRLHN